MKVSDLLPMVRANRYTYYNLDNRTVKIFKDMYSYLKRNKEKCVSEFCKKQVVNILSKNEVDYLNKYAAMLRINRMMSNNS